jgi:molybdate transport system substrate-binding protein
MRRYILIFLTLALVGSAQAADLKILSGAGLIKPMEELRQTFEQDHNVKIDVHYGSSGEIFGMLAMGQKCDVFVPGDEHYTADALRNGWIFEPSIRKMVLHVPVIVVPAGNPAGIKSLDDLAKPGVRVALGDPKAPAIGKVSRKMLSNCGLWDRVESNTAVFAPTANQLLIYAALGQVDATINWLDVTSWGEGKGKIEVVRIDPQRNLIKTIPTAVHVDAAEKKSALELNEFIASERGLAIWEKWGFEPCPR